MKKYLENLSIHVDELKLEPEDTAQTLDVLAVYSSQADTVKLKLYKAFFAFVHFHVQ